MGRLCARRRRPAANRAGDGSDVASGASRSHDESAEKAFLSVLCAGRGLFRKLRLSPAGEQRELQRTLLDEVGVATLSGSTFGPQGVGHIRLSYANSVANIERALERIALHLGAGVVTPA